jgi:hypothetical protein
MHADNVVFALVFAAAVIFFIFSLLRIRSYLLLGRGEKRSGNIPARLLKVLKTGLAQSKILRDPSAGLMHAFIFWGFVVLLTAVIEAIIQGFYSDFTLAAVGPVSMVFFASQISLVCLLSCLFFMHW